MTPEQLKQTILDAVASIGSDGQGKDGLQGYLAKLAEAGYWPPIVSDGGRGD
jgi:hypothetical protein